MRTRSSDQLAMTILGVAVAVIILVPMVVLLLRSLSQDGDGGLIPQLTLENYRQVFTDPKLLIAGRNTLITSVGATIGATVLGVSLSWLTARTDMPGTRVFETLNLVPFFMSPFVGAFAWRILAAPNVGLLNQAGDALPFSVPELNIYTLGGITWVLILFYTPYAYLFTVGSFREMDPGLEDAARVAGSSVWGTARRVTIPIIAPAIFSAMLITFVTSAGIFDVPIALGSLKGIDTLSTQIYHVLRYPADYGAAAAISSVLFVLTLTAITVQRRVVAKRSFATVTGRGYQPRKVALGGWRYVALTVNLLYIFAAAIAPILALLAVSVHSVWVGQIEPRLMTLANFVFVLFDYELTRRALVNSLILAVVGATVAVVIVVVLSYMVHRTQLSGRKVLDSVVAFPITVPGIVLAMGILLTFIRSPLYGTLWIIGLAYVVRFMPYAYRTIGSTLLSIHPELDESARVSGARWVRAMRTIVLPLLRPGIAAAWLMLFVIFIRELGSSILLYTNGTEVMSVAMLVLSSKALEATAAFGIVQTFLLLVAVSLYHRLTRAGRLG